MTKKSDKVRRGSPSIKSIHICSRLPASTSRSDFHRRSLLIYDRRLTEGRPKLRAWIQLFPLRYGVDAGEQLKDLARYPLHIQKILSKWNRGGLDRNSHLVALGGGSVGDFVAFTASILMRGVALTLIPTTWLAALDSSHGGKTALNVGGMKNQLGTFYPASKVIIAKELLIRSATKLQFDHSQDALGELFKISLIDGDLFEHIARGPSLRSSDELLWLTLKRAIEAKYRIVDQDPFELRGVRQILNLGHTFGHVIEAHYGWQHGRSVGAGLVFALKWSLHRKILKNPDFNRIETMMRQHEFWIEPPQRPIPQGKALKLITVDKKKIGSRRLRFVFLKKPGAAFIKEIPFDEMIREGVRQRWIR